MGDRRKEGGDWHLLDPSDRLDGKSMPSRERDWLGVGDLNLSDGDPDRVECERQRDALKQQMDALNFANQLLRESTSALAGEAVGWAIGEMLIDAAAVLAGVGLGPEAGLAVKAAAGLVGAKFAGDLTGAVVEQSFKESGTYQKSLDEIRSGKCAPYVREGDFLKGYGQANDVFSLYKEGKKFR